MCLELVPAIFRFLPWFRSPLSLKIDVKDRSFYVEKLVPFPLYNPAKRWRKWRHRLCLRAIGPAALKWKRIQKSKNARASGSCTYQNWPRNATASRHLSFFACKHGKVSRDAILTSLPVHFRIFPIAVRWNIQGCIRAAVIEFNAFFFFFHFWYFYDI